MKTVLITGGSRGIGAATARRFAAAGYRVAINYNRSEREALKLAEELGGTAVRADVGDPDQVQEMVDNVLDKFCQLDILVCNAGIAQQKLFGDLTNEDWKKIFTVNVEGVFYTIRAALPHMLHRKAGRIVTVSSMWGQVGGSCCHGENAAYRHYFVIYILKIDPISLPWVSLAVCRYGNSLGTVYYGASTHG